MIRYKVDLVARVLFAFFCGVHSGNVVSLLVQENENVPHLLKFNVSLQFVEVLVQLTIVIYWHLWVPKDLLTPRTKAFVLRQLALLNHLPTGRLNELLMSEGRVHLENPALYDAPLLDQHHKCSVRGLQVGLELVNC